MEQKNNYIAKKNHYQKITYCRCRRNDLKVSIGTRTISDLEAVLTLS